ncbi:MAG: T9SS type A sorting domain-containing protein [Candidatus Poribacteria bacterium]|nr:T9SS type A sorting domain-containing protein [Candidatus Poribacteria bacterium]
MLSIIGNRKIIVSMLTMVFLIVGGQGISYAQVSVVDPLDVDPSSVAPGGSFTLTVTVRNGPTAQATNNVVNFYQSVDSTITSTDTFIGSRIVSPLGANGESTVSISGPAPSTVASYNYGASVQAGTGPIDYSRAVTLTVTNLQPDLTVTLIRPYSTTTYPYNYYTPVSPGGSFTLNAIVANIGTLESPATTLTCEYSTDRINWVDTRRTVSVGRHSPGQSLQPYQQSQVYPINLIAPSNLNAPFTTGFYYYRVRVVPVAGESNLDNTSNLVSITTSSGDLVVDTPTVDKSTLAPGESFTLTAIVRNNGSGNSTATTLQYYSSTDTTISTTDTLVGTADSIGILSGYNTPSSVYNNTSTQTVELTAPSEPGTYYYGACVSPTVYELNTTNNCSTAVTITVSAPPDLVAELFELRGTSALAPGERFTLDATVTNEGVGQSAATTLRFYESIDRRFRSEDEVGRVSVSALSSNISSNESVRLVAPSEPGTYYYRAHVDEVANETVTSNNWSGYIVIFVEAPLVIESLQPSKFALAPRERFTLTATIKNDGDATSTRTTAQYYLSADDSITSRDTTLGTETVSAITAGRTTQVSRTLTAPTAAGTYYYGVCVGDDISSDTCLVIKITVVAVLIAESQRPPLYWVDADVGTLQSLTGASVDRLVPNVQNATSVAVDIADNKVYWAEQTGNNSGRIRRANLNGSNVQLVRELTSVPHRIALDTTNGTLYLTNSRGKVQRMNLNGSGFEADLIVDLASPQGIAVDVAGGKVYWTEQTSDRTGRIRRANLNGSNVQLVRELTSVPHRIALDTTNGTLYLTNSRGKVQRMNLNGSGFEADFIVNLVSPQGIAVDVAGGKIYWTEEGKIRRANLDGSNRQDVASGLGTPDAIFLQTTPVEILIRESQRPPMYWVNAGVATLQSLTGSSVDRLAPNVQNATSVAVDMADNKVYWAEQTGDHSGRIRRANLNGTNIQLVRELTTAPHRIVLDTANGTLYLTNSRGKVQRMNLNGSGFEADFIVNLASPQGIAVDAAGGKVYWTEQTGDHSGRIRRANLNGTNVQLVRELKSAPQGLAVDPSNERLYLTNSWGKVQRMNLNGSGFQPNFIVDLNAPRGIAVDVAGRKIYWTERGSIRRANLDGSNRQDVARGLGTPVSLALSVAPVSTASAPAAAAMAPNATVLHPNYPNPFNPETWIPYQLQKPADVQIAIYSQSGVLVRELSLGYQRAGQYMSRSRAAYWDGRNQLGEPVASGLYFYTLTAGDFSATRRMLILK